MWFDLNIDKYLSGVVGKGLRLNKQALAQVLPFILEDRFPELTLLHLDNGVVVLEDKLGQRWKVCCANGKRFDVAPSFTKGSSRNKSGLTVWEFLEDKYYGFIFVDFSKACDISVSFQTLKCLDVREDGVLHL